MQRYVIEIGNQKTHFVLLWSRDNHSESIHATIFNWIKNRKPILYYREIEQRYSFWLAIAQQIPSRFYFNAVVSLKNILNCARWANIFVGHIVKTLQLEAHVNLVSSRTFIQGPPCSFNLLLFFVFRYHQFHFRGKVKT